MPRILQFRRGNTSQVDTYTGAEGEIVVDLEAKTIRLHDGVVIGGHPMLSKTENDDLLTQMTQMVSDQADLDSVTTQIQSDFSGMETRLNTLETTEFWKVAADGYYVAAGSTYSKAETDTLLQNTVDNINTDHSAQYALSSNVYTKVETVDLIGENLADFATSSNLTSYRLITDSYSASEVDVKFTEINTDYYNKVDSDSIFRRLDDSKSATDVDTEFQAIRDETYDRTYLNSTFATISGTYSREDLEMFFRQKDDSFSKEETLSMIEQNSFKGGRVSVVDGTTNTEVSAGVLMTETDAEILVSFVGATASLMEVVDQTTNNVVTAQVIATETDDQIEFSFYPEADSV